MKGKTEAWKNFHGDGASINADEVAGGTRVMYWEYQGRYQGGEGSSWLSKVGALESFIPFQLDMFLALWKIYHAVDTSRHMRLIQKKRSRQDAFRMLPVGTKVLRAFILDEREGIMTGKVYNFEEPY